ncbi:hypothetical protein DICA1_D07052 [Diutina catenulata]
MSVRSYCECFKIISVLPSTAVIVLCLLQVEAGALLYTLFVGIFSFAFTASSISLGRELMEIPLVLDAVNWVLWVGAFVWITDVKCHGVCSALDSANTWLQALALVLSVTWGTIVLTEAVILRKVVGERSIVVNSSRNNCRDSIQSNSGISEVVRNGIRM